jgi:hypothetical protein
MHCLNKAHDVPPEQGTLAILDTTKITTKTILDTTKIILDTTKTILDTTKTILDTRMFNKCFR